MLVDVRPLRVDGFRRLWLAGTVTGLGAQLTAVVVPLQIYEITGSSAYVGLAALVGFAPMAVAALWGGVLADVRDRRRVLLATTIGIGATSLLLWAQAWADLRSVGVLLALVAVQQALFGANTAVSRAVTPRLVRPELLPAANALQSLVTLSAGIAGPLLAGGLLPVAGAGTLYLADAVAMGAMGWAVWRLPALPPVGSTGRRRAPFLSQILDGVGYVTRSQILLVTYLADFAALSLALPTALFPQLAEETYHPSDIGVLYAAVSAGGVLAGLVSGAFTRVTRHGVAVAVSVGVWGLAIAWFGSAGSLLPAVGWLLLAGGALLALGVFRKTVLQTAVPDGMRGRLQGLDTVVAMGGPRLGDLLHGMAGAAFGAGWVVAGGGVLAAGAAVALVVLFPEFRRYGAGIERV
ncbi:MFS transporter [Streptomyces sp. SID13726]|nr:MFS transporter [Streptomyces sp. SID13726]